MFFIFFFFNPQLSYSRSVFQGGSMFISHPPVGDIVFFQWLPLEVCVCVGGQVLLASGQGGCPVLLTRHTVVSHCQRSLGPHQAHWWAWETVLQCKKVSFSKTRFSFFLIKKIGNRTVITWQLVHNISCVHKLLQEIKMFDQSHWENITVPRKHGFKALKINLYISTALHTYNPSLVLSTCLASVRIHTWLLALHQTTTIVLFC